MLPGVQTLQTRCFADDSRVALVSGDARHPKQTGSKGHSQYNCLRVLHKDVVCVYASCYLCPLLLHPKTTTSGSSPATSCRSRRRQKESTHLAHHHPPPSTYFSRLLSVTVWRGQVCPHIQVVSVDLTQFAQTVSPASEASQQASQPTNQPRN